MKTFLSEFETIGYGYAQKLKSTLNIRTVDEFLQHNPEELQRKSDIDPQRINQWSDVLDLFRIPNLSPREAELLYNANINSVQELSHRQAIRIFYKLREIDKDTYYIILQFPTFATIENWIYFAKLMSTKIKYGQNIPIILLPMVNLQYAAAMKKYRIFTIEEFLQKTKHIKNFRSAIKMKRFEYREMLEMIELIKIGGIDVHFAQILYQSGIKSTEHLLELTSDEILAKVGPIQENESEEQEKITSAIIDEIKQNLKEESE
ncbi:MAG: DUF4332 domain-containing protein [Promethearchaeota archaeon]